MTCCTDTEHATNYREKALRRGADKWYREDKEVAYPPPSRLTAGPNRGYFIM
jgi:hypothetical protein